MGRSFVNNKSRYHQIGYFKPTPLQPAPFMSHAKRIEISISRADKNLPVSN